MFNKSSRKFISMNRCIVRRIELLFFYLHLLLISLRSSTADRINLSCVACVSRVFIKWPPFRPPICMTLLKKKRERERKRKIQIDRIIRGHDLPASQLLSAPIMRFRHGDVTGRRKKRGARAEGQSGWVEGQIKREEKEISGETRKKKREKKENQLRPFNYARARAYVCVFPFSFSSPHLSSSLLVAKGEGSIDRRRRRFKSIFGNSRRESVSIDPGNWSTGRPRKFDRLTSRVQPINQTSTSLCIISRGGDING